MTEKNKRLKMIYGTTLALMMSIGGIMKATYFSKAAQIALLLLAVGLLTACGSSKTSGSSFSGVTPAPATNTTNSSSTTAENLKAVCSQDVSALSDLQVRVMQFVDQYGQARPDFVRLQFKKAPAAWKTGNWDMYIYRWTAAPDNSTSMDSTPLPYQFEKRAASGFQILSNYVYQVFDWTEIQQMGAFANIPATTPQEFFNVATLLVNVKDSSNSYQAIRVVFRHKETKEVMSQVDVLIPEFAADPAKYNADSRHPVTLQYLHPLKDKLGQNWSQLNFFEFAKSFCF